MCGRFSLTKSKEQLGTALNINFNEDYRPSYNIAPSEEVLTLLEPEKVSELKWGLTPSWSKTPSQIIINARSETIFDKPSFKKQIKTNRCIVLADGFYEWDRLKNEEKQPFHFQLKSNDVFGIAAIWDESIKEDFKYPSCALITTSANEIVSQIHDRMPVILTQKYFKMWLNKEASLDSIKEMLVPLNPQEMESFRVNAKVNNARYKAADCIERI